MLHHGSIRRFEWETADSFGFGQQDATYAVQWAAFYSDVDHEVESVTDGTRVTLTWLLRRTALGAPIPREPAATERDLEAEFAAALADRQFLPSVGLLGIPCAHLYAAAAERTPFAGTLSKARASTLKGIGSSPLPRCAPVLVSFDQNLQGYTPERRAAFAARFVERASDVPGVTSVAAADILPLGGEMYGGTIVSDNGTSSSRVSVAQVSARYFETLDLAIVRGRA